MERQHIYANGVMSGVHTLPVWDKHMRLRYPVSF